MATSHGGTCPHNLLQGLVTGISPLVCDRKILLLLVLNICRLFGLIVTIYLQVSHFHFKAFVSEFLDPKDYKKCLWFAIFKSQSNRTVTEHLKYDQDWTLMRFKFQTTDGAHVLTPSPLAFGNSKMHYPPMPSEFHDHEPPPFPSEILFFWKYIFFMNKRTYIYASSRLWSSSAMPWALLFSDKKNQPHSILEFNATLSS